MYNIKIKILSLPFELDPRCIFHIVKSVSDLCSNVKLMIHPCCFS